MLPDLENGQSLEVALAQLPGFNAKDVGRDNAAVQLYFHTLLINREGHCEKVYVTVTHRSDLNKDFGEDKSRQNRQEAEETQAKVTAWLQEQVFQTNTIPWKFQKFKYCDFVYF